MVSMDDESTELSADNFKHVQIQFISKEKELINVPDAIFDVPTTADCENLNGLVNKTIQAVNAEWSGRNFEFLVGETFIRSSIAEFIEEYNVETETVIKVECILGLEAPKPLHDLPAPDWVSTVLLTSSHVLSTTYNGEAIFWDKKGTQTLSVQRDKGTAYKCSAIIKSPKNSKNVDGCEFVVGGENQTITIFHVEGGQATPKAVLRGHERSVEAVAVNTDKTRLISGAFDSNLKVWNLQDDDATTIFEKQGENIEKSKKRKENYVTKTPMVTLGGHRDAIIAVEWSTWNKAQALSASWDNTIILWDLELAGEVSRIRGQKAFSSMDLQASTGLLISGSTDSVPRLYDPRSHEGTMVKQSFIGHMGWISAVKWNPENDNCFVSGSFDKSVKMWDIRSAKTSLFDLHGHDDRVLCVDWSSGRIASGSVDCTVKVFST